MSNFNIRTAGTPGGEVLTQIAREVTEEEFGLELQEYTARLLETMYAANGVGLAAPQVGDSRRIIVVDAGQELASEYSSGFRCLINPFVVEQSEEVIKSEEGCLSVPYLYVAVERPISVRVNYRTPSGDTVVEDFDGFMATKVQHEIDHLNGITLLKHASNLKRSLYQKKIKKIVKRIMERQNDRQSD